MFDERPGCEDRFVGSCLMDGENIYCLLGHKLLLGLSWHSSDSDQWGICGRLCLCRPPGACKYVLHLLKFSTWHTRVNVWEGMDMRDHWHTAWCICPRFLPMYAWHILQGPFCSRIACLHDGWRIRDPWNGEDRGVVDHPLFFLPHPLLFLGHPLFCPWRGR